jgi:hypothetical protein
MYAILVYDLGPPHDDPERARWEKVNGKGACEMRTEQRNICECDPRRYVRELPAGVTVTSRTNLG